MTILSPGAVHQYGEEYEVGPFLARGGNKVVHQGVQRSTGIPVALMAPITPLHAEAFLREAMLLGRLVHQGIPQVLAIMGLADNRPILVQRLIDGGTNWRGRLRQQQRNYTAYNTRLRSDRRALRQLQRNDLEQNLDILVAVGRILSTVHRTLGIIHRDIKPSNIQVTNAGEVYLIDWGLGVVVNPQPELAGLPRADEIRSVEGTPLYMAPEMARQPPGPFSLATDVFLLGATLYEMLTGSPPYTGSFVLDRARLRDIPAIPDQNDRGSIPPGLVKIAWKAMARDPADRYPDAGAFLEALENHRRYSAEETLRWTRRAALIGGGVLLTGLIGTAVLARR